MTPANVRDLVYGALFTRGPADLHATAIFIGGSNVAAGEAVLEAVKATFFGPFRVSVLFDANGANTTAAAAVLAALQSLRRLARGRVGRRPGGDRPGRPARRPAAAAGWAAKVAVGSRSLDRAADARRDRSARPPARRSPRSPPPTPAALDRGAPGSVGHHRRRGRRRHAPARLGLAEPARPQGPDRPERRSAPGHRRRRGHRQGHRARRGPRLGRPGRRRHQDEDPQEGDPGTVHVQRQGPRRRAGARAGPILG